MPETALPAGTTATQEAGITAALGARSIVLVGMMGAGKSTIGRRLSARLRLPFLDADTVARDSCMEAANMLVVGPVKSLDLYG